MELLDEPMRETAFPKVSVCEDVEPISPGTSEPERSLSRRESYNRMATKHSMASYGSVGSMIASLELLEVWTESHRQRRRKRHTSGKGRTSIASLDSDEVSSIGSSWGSEGSESASLPQKTSWMERKLQPVVLHPSCAKLIAWDSLTLVTLLYDIMFIPLAAYNLDLSPIVFLELMATSVWTADMALSFFKGFEISGIFEMRIRKIVSHYFRGWFAFDFSIVVVDWLLLLFDSGDFVDWLRMTRIRRALRLLKLARFARHGAKFAQLNNFIISEELVSVMSIVQLLLLLVGINHFMSSGWYAVGTLDLRGPCWTEAHFGTEHTDSFWYRYLTSFHWSITQFTPASMEVTPTNVYERVFNIFAIFFGLVMFSSFVSSMTNSMTYLRHLNSEKRQQNQALRSYFTSRGLTLELSNSIMAYLRTNSQKVKRLQEADLSCLAVLPSAFLKRLHEELYTGSFGRHSLFYQIRVADLQAWSVLCNQAMSERSCPRGHELFRVDTQCTHMYFIVAGSASYIPIFDAEELAPLEATAGNWISEPCLWLKWQHRGRLTASGRGVLEIAQLEVAQFIKLGLRTCCVMQLQKYARIYAETCTQDCYSGKLISDLWGQRTCVQRIANQAFAVDPEEAAAKLLVFWKGNAISPERVFAEWSRVVRRRRRLRKILPRCMLSLCL